MDVMDKNFIQAALDHDHTVQEDQAAIRENIYKMECYVHELRELISTIRRLKKAIPAVIRNAIVTIRMRFTA